MDDINSIFSVFRDVVGEEANMTNYIHRLMLQKLVFILKTLSYNVSYNFSWYMRGPYSPDLTRDAFKLFESGKFSYEKRNDPAIDKLKELVEQNPDEDKLELIASVIYLIKVRKLNEDELISSLLTLKPWFSAEQIRESIEKVSKFIG